MHVQTLKRTIGQRLHKLELRSARSGINTPPEIAIEAEDLGKVLKALQRLEYEYAVLGEYSDDLYLRTLNTLRNTEVVVSSIEFGNTPQDRYL